MDHAAIDEIFRREGGRVLATLIRLLGDFELAEEARQEALAAALEQWPVDGIPDEPRAWLVHVAKNKGIDREHRPGQQHRCGDRHHKRRAGERH